MIKKIQCFIKNNKKFMIFIPIYLIFMFIIAFLMGFSMDDNRVWENGVKKAKSK